MKRTQITKKLGILLLAASLAAAPTISAAYTVSAAASPPQTTNEGDSETLKLSTKTYQKTYKTKNDIIYKTISYEYPVAEGDSDAADAFNQFYTELRSKWIKSAKENLKEAKDTVKKLTDNTGDQYYSDKVTCKITSSDENYISILQSGYEYSMGAHGTPYRISHIFDTKTGTEVSANDLLSLTEDQLNNKIRKQFLKKFDKTQNSEKFLFYQDRDDVKLTLEKLDFNDNYYYIKNGKIFFYADPYAVGPYASGFIEVSVKLQK